MARYQHLLQLCQQRDDHTHTHKHTHTQTHTHTCTHTHTHTHTQREGEMTSHTSPVPYQQGATSSVSHPKTCSESHPLYFLYMKNYYCHPNFKKKKKKKKTQISAGTGSLDTSQPVVCNRPHVSYMVVCYLLHILCYYSLIAASAVQFTIM